MPEGRPFPNKFFPRYGQRLSITFGEPVEPSELQHALHAPPTSDKSLDAINTPSDTLRHAYRPLPWLAPTPLLASQSGTTLARSVQGVRSEVTAIIQRAVEALGREVSGDLLGKR
jgi:monolysocardiolipin acyltransferase